jgi:phospholipase D
MQAYTLTTDPIINQLISAKKRGVKVIVLLDKSAFSDNKNTYDRLQSSGIEAHYDHMPGIAHNKIIIIDNKKVITGSFNFTRGADFRNAENVILIEDYNIAKIYKHNWDSRYANFVK